VGHWFLVSSGLNHRHGNQTVEEVHMHMYIINIRHLARGFDSARRRLLEIVRRAYPCYTLLTLVDIPARSSRSDVLIIRVGSSWACIRTCHTASYRLYTQIMGSIPIRGESLFGELPDARMCAKGRCVVLRLRKNHRTIMHLFV